MDTAQRTRSNQFDCVLQCTGSQLHKLNTTAGGAPFDSLLTSFLKFNLQLGNIIGNYATGLLLHAFGNWQIAFYAFSCVGIVIAILIVSVCSK